MHICKHRQSELVETLMMMMVNIGQCYSMRCCIDKHTHVVSFYRKNSKALFFCRTLTRMCLQLGPFIISRGGKIHPDKHILIISCCSLINSLWTQSTTNYTNPHHNVISDEPATWALHYLFIYWVMGKRQTKKCVC